MRKIIQYAAIAVCLVPIAAFAAYNDVTLGISTVISVGGSNYTVSGAAAVLQSITVNAGSFDMTVAPGSTLSVTSSNQSNYTVTTDPLVSSSVSCPSINSVLSLTASGTTTVTVTPNSVCTILVTGGGSGGGGGGSAYTPPPSPSPVPPATTTATTTLISRATTTSLFEATTTVVIVHGPVLTKTLQLGSTDPEVIELQQFLIAKTMLVLPTTIPQGYFGVLTVSAVMKFQESVGLDALGIVGPRTREAIASSTITKYVTSGIPKGFVFTRNIKIGSSGADVSALQQLLIAKGFLVFNAKSTPGYFGGLTRIALMNFQQSLGLERIGTVGPRTRKALNTLLAQ